MAERSITIKVHNLADLQQLSKLFADAPEQLEARLHAIIVDGAHTIAQRGRDNAPVRTGFLRRWIWSRETSEGAGVYSSAPYSYFVEEGHFTAAKHVPARFIPGQHFMRRAFNEIKPFITERLDDEVLKYFTEVHR